METNLVASQPEQTTAAPVVEESTPSQVEPTPTPVSPEPEKEPEWFVKRIGEMTAKWRADERRAIEAERQLEYFRQQQQPVKQAEPEVRKKLEDFGYDESKYQDYLFQEAEKRAEIAARRVRVEEQERTNTEKRVRRFKEREVAFEKDKPDYREVAHYAPINEAVSELVMELESGPELAYYLGKNREIALHLNDLPKHIAAVELGRIDARLSAEKASKAAALEAAKAAKAVSQAPPPAPKIDGSDAKVDKDPSEMSDVEFAKWRKRQIAQRR